MSGRDQLLGQVAGQSVDLTTTDQAIDFQTLEFIHSRKTGALFTAAAALGAMGARGEERAAIISYAKNLGLAFQIVDDLLDVEESSEHLGKTAGKDAQQQKITFPAVYGLERSHRMAEEECARAHAALAPFGAGASRLHELADMIVNRKS